MSLASGYRSRQSVFDFGDDYGQDPIMGRYGNTLASRELSQARAAESASEVELARASLNAVTEPVRQMSDFFQNVNSAVKQQEDMYRTARVSGLSAQVRPLLEKAKTWEELTALRSNSSYADVWQDEELSSLYEAKKLGARNLGIATLQNRLPKATGTAEIDGLVNEFSWLAGDPEAQTLINTFTPLAKRRETAMKGLTQLGAQTMPVTSQGEFDVDRAENIVDTLGRTDIRTLSAAQRGLQQQLSNVEDPESQEAVALQTDLTNINRQIANVANRSDQQTTRAAMDLEALGGNASSDWVDDMINGTVTAPAAATEIPAPAAATTAPESQAATTAPEPAPAVEKPEPKKPDSRVTKAEESLDAAREQAGLAQQPWGVRQINETFSVDNEEVREKAAKARQARESIDPYDDEDLKDPQAIQNALRVVYPEIGEGTNRFDVGNPEDPRVILAAEYLQRVEPSLLKRIAASPGRGGRRGSLTFDELPELAKRAASTRSKVRTGAPRGSRE